MVLKQTYRKLFRKSALQDDDDEPPRLSFEFSVFGSDPSRRGVSAVYELNPRWRAIGRVGETGTFRGPAALSDPIPMKRFLLFHLVLSVVVLPLPAQEPRAPVAAGVPVELQGVSSDMAAAAKDRGGKTMGAFRE